MTITGQISKPDKLLTAVVVAMAVATWLGVAFWAAGLSRAAATDALRDNTRNSLALQVQTLQGVLEKYRYLPTLLAHRGDVKALFPQRGETVDQKAAQAFMVDTAGLSGAVDIGLLKTDGTILGSLDTVLTAQDASTLQSLTVTPVQGSLGRTLLRYRGRPYYAFSYGVRENNVGAVQGVVAVVVDLEGLVEAWQLALDPIFLTAPDGTLMVGNDLADASFEGRLDAPIEVSRYLPQTGWTLHVRRSDKTAQAAWWRTFGAISLASLLLAVIASTFWWRRRTQQALKRQDKAQALRLERRVRDRTRDLADANHALRAAQDDLVETAKLAALGRMSASLAHEYNQPLAAIRAYADNALKLLERDQPADATEALERIGTVTNRMSGLSKALRSFARSPGQTIRAVRLTEVVEEVRLLIDPISQKTNVTVSWPGVSSDVTVAGGTVRLSQILVNLLSNAVSAAEERVTFTIECLDETVSLTVSDDGSGVSEEDAPYVFEPFFTTRPVGEGLGLGLSIAYNIAHDFGGTLRLLDNDPGATFQLVLKRHEANAVSNSDDGVLLDA
ncbi:sensor histidine kinase [Ahrensia sp. R2A130]|uniref:sensor histidine kinase n=1 Tax=Ahrensia sp. R2A130 TaxID=744979 RepID=UPI0018DD8094|nr:ATP-binding protein [Ahrensia sp. R2A130]